MKFITCISLFLMSCILFSGCEDTCQCFEGTGPLTYDERPVEAIGDIDLGSDVDLYLHHGDVPRIRVTAGQNLIDNIETKLEGDKLFIRNHNKCNWVRSFNPVLRVDVWTTNLHHLKVDDASGDVIFVDSLVADEFWFDSFSSTGTYYLLLNCSVSTIAMHNGPADITVKGHSGVTYMFNAGFGKMDCLELESGYAFVRNRGTNDLYLHVNILLEAITEHKGNIYYRGNPGVVDIELNGTGNVIQIP